MQVIDAGLRGDRPISCAADRYGAVVIAQEGGGPLRLSATGEVTSAGIPAPATPPAVSTSLVSGYYVARTDVTKPGAVYFAPPHVSYEFECGDPDPRFRPAVARSYLSQASVSEIDNTSGGKYYPCEPTVSLSSPHGSGAQINAVLDAPEAYFSDPDNSPETGLTGFALVSDGPPWADEQALPNDVRSAEYAIWEYLDVPISGNGIQRIAGPKRWFSTTNCNGGTSSYFVQYSTDVEVVGYTTGSGAKARIFASGHQYLGADCSCPTPSTSFCFFNLVPATGFGSAAPYRMGKGYDKEAEIAIIVPAASVFDPDTNRTIYYNFNAGSNTKAVNALHWQKAIVIRVYSGEDPRNPGGGIGYPLKSIEIAAGGSGYLVAPQLQIVSSSGFGAYATCTVKSGAIDTVTLENGGGGYKTRPDVKILSGGAEAFAISRQHLRGLYQCYYRYTDDTPDDFGGPIAGNLSPALELDAGEGTSGITWEIAAPTGARASHIELWRSTSGQATTLYRVARISRDAWPEEGYFDDLTDEELRDPDRPLYSAMPILLPNGELNAMRFSVPPTDKSAVVWFQDRMWYGVGGRAPNAVYYSEVDEAESVPKENEIVIQSNGRSADSLRAMIPFGSTLFLAQDRNLFSLSFSQIPVLDGQVSVAAFRGCLNQRCWQIHEGYAYIMDRHGLYRLGQSGAVEDLSAAVRDQFEGQIDFSNPRWNFVAVDFESRTVRCFVSHVEDGGGDYPTRALCLDIDSGALWWEKYPQRITSSAITELSVGSVIPVYACEGGAYSLDSGALDYARGAIVKITLRNKGRGYREPPDVLASGGRGAVLQSSLNADGELSAIWILDPGAGYEDSALLIGPPNDPAVPEGERVQATAVCQATPLGSDTAIYPTFRFKTGCVEYPTDSDARDGGATTNRDMRLYYAPTKVANELSVRMYYNNATHPRPNVAERDRGTGFVDSTVDPAARIDLGYMTMAYGSDPGAARAIRTGKTIEDIRSGDRDVAVQVCGPSIDAKPVTIYGIDIFGGNS